MPECWARRWSLNLRKVAATAIVSVRLNVGRAMARGVASVVPAMARAVRVSVVPVDREDLVAVDLDLRRTHS